MTSFRPAPAASRAVRSRRAWLVLLTVVTIGLAADLGSKSWAFRSVGATPVVLDRARLVNDPTFDPTRPTQRRPVLPGRLLDFKLFLNPGAVFGIGANQRVFFVGFTLVAVVGGLLLFGWCTARDNRLAHVGLGLVVAGGLGNLYDRLAFGRVRDFIQLLPGRLLPKGWTWPGTNNPEMFPWVFNIADVLLLMGMVALIVHVNRMENRRAAAESAAESA